MIEYEKMVQKLEGDVRNHIRIEQQLKLHIETIQNKLEDYEKSRVHSSKKNVDQVEQLKKENRRMDELITVKEEKIKRLEEMCDQSQRKLKNSEEDSVKCKALEEKIKFIEKQYNKDLQKLQSELNLYKKYQQS